MIVKETRVSEETQIRPRAWPQGTLWGEGGGVGTRAGRGSPRTGTGVHLTPCHWHLGGRSVT